jgi:hypothetical protein
MPRRLYFRLMGVSLGVLFALILCEIFLRLWIATAPDTSRNGFIRFARQHTYNFEGALGRTPIFRKTEDAGLGWEPVPNSHMADLRINSGGFRGREYGRVAGAGVTRIVFLGDSETFGERLQEDETVPGQLEIVLHEIDPTRNYEVLNFGVIGYNTSQEFNLLKKTAMAYEPSIVVLYYVFNDPEIATPISLSSPGVLAASRLFQYLVYWRHSLTTVVDLHNQSHNIVEYYNALHSSIYFEAVRKIIAEMGDYLAARQIQFYVLIAPEIYDVKNFREAYPYHAIHQKLAALASSHVIVVDPLPQFASRFDDPKKLWVTPFDPHKNKEANRVLAEVLAGRRSLTESQGR